MDPIKPSRPAPPRPTPKPGRVKVFRALFKYEAQHGDELSFDEGDLLYISDQTNKDWYKAKCGDKTGLIPSNYVEESMETLDNPLHEAAKRGNIHFMKECIANNVSVNGLDKAGSTPIHWAAHGGHIECLRTLLDQPRCEINVQNKLGDTPLHSAAWRGHSEAIRILLERGARTDLLNKDKKLPYNLAKDPASAGLLQQARRSTIPSDDYGDEGDSD